MNLLTTSPITGLTYYLDRDGDEYILYAEIEPHQVAAQVKVAAIREIPVGVLREALRQQGVKGSFVPCSERSENGLLPIAVFSGRDNPLTPRLQQLN